MAAKLPTAHEVVKSFTEQVGDVRTRVLEARTVSTASAIFNAAGEKPTARIQKRKLGMGEPDASTGTNQVTRDDYATAFTNLGAIDPVYDPEMLCLLFEHSNSLRQNVDAYAVNIDGFGHRFDPVFDLSSKDVDQRIADAMLMDRQRALDESMTSTEAQDPTPQEVAEVKKRIERRMRIEKNKLQMFFEFCSPDTSFVTLRKRTRQDLEVMGNAYWEVLKNGEGEIAQFVYVPGFTMRLLPLDMDPVLVKHRVRVSDLSFDDVEYTTRLRRYVQIVEGRAAFFKGFGDPRIISSESGAVFDSLEQMKEIEPTARPANEVLHFNIHSPRSPYGVPRWIGNLLAVIGSRQAEEVNFNYFENKSVPPLAILVSGGRMAQSSVERVESYIEANLKGKRNFHKILVIEAESAQGGGKASDSNTAKMKIDIKPLTGAQHSDALFQEYDERNIDKVGQSFRLSRMLRGDIRDFNRATAEAAMVFAEMQVFEPERQEFDFILNRKILTALGIRFWKIVSLAPVMRDPSAMASILKDLSNAGVLTPEEARDLAGDVFNREFKHLDAGWTKQPIALTVAGIQPEGASGGAQGAPTGQKPPTADAGWNRDEVAPEKPGAMGIESRLTKAFTKTLKYEAAKMLAIRNALRIAEGDEYHRKLLQHAQADAAAE